MTKPSESSIQEVTGSLRDMDLKDKKVYKCSGVKKGDAPCLDSLQYSDETAHLFVKGSRTQCRKCRGKYMKEYRLKNLERCTEIQRNADQKQRMKRNAILAEAAAIILRDSLKI